MIKINKGFFISFIALLLVNYTIGNFISYSLTLVLMTIFFVDIVSLLIARILLNIEITLDEVANVGENISVVYIGNKLSIGLASNIFVSNEVISDISQDEIRKIELNIDGRQFNFSAKKRGKYLLDHLDIELHSISNLISIKGKYKINKLIKIYPNIYSLNYNYKLYSGRCGVEKSSRISKDRTSNINNIRQYEVGDSLEDIHWKITAKENKLYTKTYVDECNEEKIIITSYALEKDDLNYCKEEETIAAFVISLCNDFIYRNHHIKLLINNGEKVTYDISNNIDVNNLLEYSLENKFCSSGDNHNIYLNNVIENNWRAKNIILIISNIDDSIKKIIDKLDRKGSNITIYFDSCNKNYSFNNNIQIINIRDYIKGDREYEKRNIS